MARLVVAVLAASSISDPLCLCHTEKRRYLYGLLVGYYAGELVLKFNEGQRAFGWYDTEGIRFFQVKWVVDQMFWISIPLTEHVTYPSLTVVSFRPIIATVCFNTDQYTRCSLTVSMN
jgi:hypothetical protein